MISEILFSSKTELWATPRDFYDMLNDVYAFTLDPCANTTNAKCSTFFTKEQDGLAQDWGAHRVFCNPPYGRVIGKWVKKCYEAAQNGALVVLLVPARTDTRWFHDYVIGKARIEFIRGRLKFGGSKNCAPFPSMLAIYHPGQ